MLNREIAALNAAMAPEVSPADRDAIREWAEQTIPHVTLLEGVFDGIIVITGFDRNNGEPTWVPISTPEADRATPEWIGRILRRVGVLRD